MSFGFRRDRNKTTSLDSLDNTRVVFVNEAIRNFDKQKNT